MPHQRFQFGEVDSKAKEQLVELAMEFRTIFNNQSDVPPAAKVDPIHCDPARPVDRVYTKPYRRSLDDKKFLTDTMKHLVEKGLYVPSEAPHSSEFTVVPKPNGKKRLCNSLKMVNEQYDLFMIPLPTIPEITEQMAGSKYFSSIDLLASFLQCPISKELSERMTMNTPLGPMRPTRLVYGWKNSPGYFC